MVFVTFVSGFSGKTLARIEFCWDATIGAFNTALKNKCYRIVEGMQYVRHERAITALSTDHRVFPDPSFDPDEEQVWQVVFDTSETANAISLTSLPFHTGSL